MDDLDFNAPSTPGILLHFLRASAYTETQGKRSVLKNDIIFYDAVDFKVPLKMKMQQQTVKTTLQ